MGRGANKNRKKLVVDSGTSFLSTSAIVKQNSNFESYRGHTWAKPLSRSLNPPSVQVDDRSYYPVPFPTEVEVGALYRELWQLLVVEGKTFRVEDLRRHLANPDRGKKPIKLGDEPMRHQLREFGIRMCLPVSGMVQLFSGDSKKFGIARNRDQVDSYIKSLEGRIEGVKQAGRTLKDLRCPDFSLEAWEPSENFKWKQDLDPLFSALSEEAITNKKIKQILGNDSLAVRELIHDLRVEGVPICGSSRGYWLAASQADLTSWLKTMRSRGEAMTERIQKLEEAKELWFPEDGPNISAPFQTKPSKQADDREAKKQEVREQRSEDRRLREDAEKQRAQTFLGQLKADGLEAAQHRVGFDLSPSKEDRRKVEEANRVRRFLQTGKVPSRRDGGTSIWEPEKRRKSK